MTVRLSVRLHIGAKFKSKLRIRVYLSALELVL